MSIAFIGNLNNNHHAIVKYLRSCGVDAYLLLTDEPLNHFHPSNDSFDFTYREFVRQLSWGSSTAFLRTPRSVVEADLAPYDVIAGCGWAPAYSVKIGRALDIFLPVGGDLNRYTKHKLTHPSIFASYNAAVSAQQKGIRAASVVHMAPTQEDGHYERKLRELRAPNALRWTEPLPMLFQPDYEPDNLARMYSRTHWWAEFEKVRQANDLVVCYHGRHQWLRPEDDPTCKGVDRLLEGIARFRDRNPAVRVALVTVEYGRDLTASRELISRLGINELVHWFPLMSRKDLMVGLSYCDIVCGEFQYNYITFGTLVEAMVARKPILAWRDDADFEDEYPWLYPILNAKTSDDIAARLEDYQKNTSHWRHAGSEGTRWYEEQVDLALSRYVEFVAGESHSGRMDAV